LPFIALLSGFPPYFYYSRFDNSTPYFYNIRVFCIKHLKHTHTGETIMIQLKLKTFESEVESHPVVAGSSSIVYTVNHGLGVRPDLSKMYKKVGGYWVEYFDQFGWQNSSNIQGYSIDDAPDSNNIKFRVFRVSSVITDIKFRCFKF